MSAAAPRLSACITFDFDALSPWVADAPKMGPASLSRGEFGAVAIPRILAILRRHSIRTTFFIPGHTALAYPRELAAIMEDGHEIGHHGWVHETPAFLEPGEEERVFERGLHALEAAGGARPIGYRAPSALISAHTVEILLAHGFTYDASCSATDFEPYYFRRGDRYPLDEPAAFGEPVDLVAIPFAWTLSDFAHLELVPDGSSWSQNLPADVFAMWRGEFDAAYETCPGGVYDLALHPQCIGRAYRLRLLEELIEHIAGHEGVVFEAVEDVARRFRDANPVAEWAARR
jgi:peptidoglycan/xylan/chitin deacetylase (PgdA/CDA1 family)